MSDFTYKKIADRDMVPLSLGSPKVEFETEDQSLVLFGDIWEGMVRG